MSAADIAGQTELESCRHAQGGTDFGYTHCSAVAHWGGSLCCQPAYVCCCEGSSNLYKIYGVAECISNHGRQAGATYGHVIQPIGVRPFPSCRRPNSVELLPCGSCVNSMVSTQHDKAKLELMQADVDGPCHRLMCQQHWRCQLTIHSRPLRQQRMERHCRGRVHWGEMTLCNNI